MNLDGGIHDIPLPRVPGRLWLCGKHAIAPDPVQVLDELGAHHVVCLVECFEIEDRYPRYVEWLETSGAATWFPIPDLDFPQPDDVRGLLASMKTMLTTGTSIVAHCAAGIGRAGTVAVAMCLELGMDLDAALAHVRHHRPGAGPEVGAQRDFIEFKWAEVQFGQE